MTVFHLIFLMLFAEMSHPRLAEEGVPYQGIRSLAKSNLNTKYIVHQTPPSFRQSLWRNFFFKDNLSKILKREKKAVSVANGNLQKLPTKFNSNSSNLNKVKRWLSSVG